MDAKELKIQVPEGYEIDKENHILHAYFMFILFILFLLVCFINISSKLDTMNQKLDKMLKEQIELSNYLCD